MVVSSAVIAVISVPISNLQHHLALSMHSLFQKLQLLVAVSSNHSEASSSFSDSKYLVFSSRHCHSIPVSMSKTNQILMFETPKNDRFSKSENIKQQKYGKLEFIKFVKFKFLIFNFHRNTRFHFGLCPKS